LKIPAAAIVIPTVNAAMPKYHPDLTLKIKADRAKRKTRKRSKQRNMAQVKMTSHPNFVVDRFS